MKFSLASALLAAVTGVTATAVTDRSSHYHHIDVVEEEERSGPSTRQRIPTSYESAVLARRILNLTPFGTVSTVFPSDGVFAADSFAVGHAHSWESRPAGLGGIPIGLPEYVAACEGGPDGGNTPESAAAAGNPTLLAIRIATTFRNAKAGSNVSLALQWTPPASSSQVPPPHHPPRPSFWPIRGLQAVFGGGALPPPPPPPTAMLGSYAALPRFSLIGYLEPITGHDIPLSPVAKCFTRTHPDAKWWLPGNPVHESGWVRLVVTQVYWVGGFGDRAYIGWIPIDEWRNVTRAEWEQVRLPGEHKAAAL